MTAAAPTATEAPDARASRVSRDLETLTQIRQTLGTTPRAIGSAGEVLGKPGEIRNSAAAAQMLRKYLGRGHERWAVTLPPDLIGFPCRAGADDLLEQSGAEATLGIRDETGATTYIFRRRAPNGLLPRRDVLLVPPTPGRELVNAEAGITEAPKAILSGTDVPETKAPTPDPTPEDGEAPLECPVEEMVICLADVTEARWAWLLKDRIPFGAITGVTGAPGQGKSAIMHDLTAKWSGGKELPDGSRHDPLNTLILTREDHAAKTLRPRLRAAGAAMERVFIWNQAPCSDRKMRSPNVVEHLDSLAKIVQEKAIRVVIVDPLMTFLGMERSAFAPQEMADAMSALQEKVEALDVAMTIINHPPKGTGRTAIERFMGTMSIAGVLRALFEVRPDPDDPQNHLLVQSKTNLAPEAGALAYRIIEGFLAAEDQGAEISTARVEWLGVQEGVTAQSLDAADKKASPATEKAMEFLALRLCSASTPDSGELAHKLIDEAEKEEGISKNAIFAAKKDLGVKSTPKEFGGYVKWYLPKTEVPPE